MNAQEITKKDNEFRDYFSAKIKEYRKAANKEALEKLIEINNRLIDEHDNGFQTIKRGIPFVEIYNFLGKDWFVALQTLINVSNNTFRAINHVSETNPALKRKPEPYGQSINKSELTPQNAPNEGTSEIYAGLEWKGHKADLAELVKGLYHSKTIYKDKKPINLIDLQRLFEKLFSIEIRSFDDTFKARLGTYHNEDGKLFLDNLSELNRKEYKRYLGRKQKPKQA